MRPSDQVQRKQAEALQAALTQFVPSAPACCKTTPTDELFCSAKRAAFCSGLPCAGRACHSRDLLLLLHSRAVRRSEPALLEEEQQAHSHARIYQTDACKKEASTRNNIRREMRDHEERGGAHVPVIMLTLGTSPLIRGVPPSSASCSARHTASRATVSQLSLALVIFLQKLSRANS
jgi:hypothetical protein